MTGDKPRDWVKWLLLAEWWYNTNYHSSIKASPYEVIYGKSPTMHLPYQDGNLKFKLLDKSLLDRESILKSLKENLARA